MRAWEDVAALALPLPDTGMAAHHGTPVRRVNGQASIWSRRAPDSVHVMSPDEEKALPIEPDALTSWRTPHHEDWPDLHVRHGTAKAARIAHVVGSAWRDRAKKPRRAVFGQRP